MRAMVNRDTCIGCGLCIDTSPVVFEMGDDGIARVIVETVPKDQEAACREAEKICPVNAVAIEE